MSQTAKPFKLAAYVSLALLCFLLLGAGIFYKERMLFIDAPHILFRIINTGTLQIQESRYGSFITQTLPLIGMKLHLPLKVLMIIYSLSFNLFYLAVALLLVFRYRRHDLAILLAVYFTLFVSDTFYWPNDEVHQGITWLLLAFAIVNDMAVKKRPFVFTAIVFFILFYLSVWTHPLVIFAAMYLWFFYWVCGEEWPYTRLQSSILTGLLCIVVCTKFLQSQRHGYDSGLVETITHFKVNKILLLVRSPQSLYFLKNCLTHYWLFSIIFLIAGTSLMVAKKYVLLAMMLLFTIGHYALLCIIYWHLDGLRYYMESEYMPLAIFAAAPFLYFFLKKFPPGTIAVILGIVFFIRLLYIFGSAGIYSHRLAELEKISTRLTAGNFSKAILPAEEDEFKNKLFMTWGIPVETLMLSALKHEYPQRTLIILPPVALKQVAQIGKDTLLGCFEHRAFSKLNNYYFQIDTNSNYKVISLKDLGY